MTERLAALIREMKEKHRSVGFHGPACNFCGFSWPCDTIRALGVIEDLAKALSNCADAIDDEVAAGDDGEHTHPLIKAHVQTAKQARAVLASADEGLSRDEQSAFRIRKVGLMR